MADIKTVRIGDKLIVMNGVDPLAYVDLTKVNKGNRSKAIVRYNTLDKVSKFIYKVKK